MRREKAKYILVIIMIVLLISSISYIYLFNKISYPFDPVRDMRSNVENYELIDIEKTETGTMVYSVGKVNNGIDNMYFVDMVNKSLLGYKWLGGGGHINRDIGRNNDYVFSAQLLNEEQNVNPTIFGVFSDEKIKNITVTTHRIESYDAVIHQSKRRDEQFYYIPLTSNVSNYKFFKFVIIYEDNEKAEYIVADKEVARFQKGETIYFY